MRSGVAVLEVSLMSYSFLQMSCFYLIFQGFFVNCSLFSPMVFDELLKDTLMELGGLHFQFQTFKNKHDVGIFPAIPLLLLHHGFRKRQTFCKKNFQVM
jgi:hypothetical protein